MKTLETVTALLNEKLAIVKPNAKTKKEIKVLQAEVKKLSENVNSENVNSENVNVNMLNALSAIGISEKTKSINAVKSIFKKEFNNKGDRTKCRTKFLNAVQLFLLNTAMNKKELAEKELQTAKDVAKTYYNAEDTFKNYSDYCTTNMDADKQNAIKMFIEVVNK